MFDLVGGGGGYRQGSELVGEGFHCYEELWAEKRDRGLSYDQVEEVGVL